MIRSTRATLAVGLGLFGVAGLVGSTMGQAPQDGKVRQVAAAPATTNPAATAPSAMPAAGGVTIGSIDMDKVLKEYDRFKVATETLRAEAMDRHNTLMKLATEAKKEQELLERMSPGGPDAKKCADRITQLKAQFEAGRESAQREFEQKESETMATIYNEIQAMARGVAKQRGMTFVVKYTNQQATGSEPNSVMAAMSRTILYADERVDITNDVTRFLNYVYKTNNGPPPKGTTTVPATGTQAPATRPRTPAAPADPTGN